MPNKVVIIQEKKNPNCEIQYKDIISGIKLQLREKKSHYKIYNVAIMSNKVTNTRYKVIMCSIKLHL